MKCEPRLCKRLAPSARRPLQSKLACAKLLASHLEEGQQLLEKQSCGLNAV
jgi:hypothetical protein